MGQMGWDGRIMGKQCQPYAARQSHLQHTGRTKVFFLIQDNLRLPQRVSHFISILVDFVSPKNIDIDTLDCCALLPVVDGYIPPAVLHTTYIQREPRKKRWHLLPSLRTCLGKPFCR